MPTHPAGSLWVISLLSSLLKTLFKNHLRVGEKYWQNLGMMFLFLLDLQQWRDQGPPRASWNKGRTLQPLEPVAGSSLPGTAGESLRGAPTAVSYPHLPRRPPPCCRYARGWRPPPPGCERARQPPKLRHLCLPGTQRRPKMYLSGHCHWKASGLFLEGRTCLSLLLSKMVRIHKAGMSIG